MILKYYSKNVYGKTKFYLVDCPEARAINALTGQVTINSDMTIKLKTLGFELEQVLNPDESLNMEQ